MSTDVIPTDTPSATNFWYINEWLQSPAWEDMPFSISRVDVIVTIIAILLLMAVIVNKLYRLSTKGRESEAKGQLQCPPASVQQQQQQQQAAATPSPKRTHATTGSEAGNDDASTTSSNGSQRHRGISCPPGVTYDHQSSYPIHVQLKDSTEVVAIWVTMPARGRLNVYQPEGQNQTVWTLSQTNGQWAKSWESAGAIKCSQGVTVKGSVKKGWYLSEAGAGVTRALTEVFYPDQQRVHCKDGEQVEAGATTPVQQRPTGGGRTRGVTSGGRVSGSGKQRRYRQRSDRSTSGSAAHSEVVPPARAIDFSAAASTAVSTAAATGSSSTDQPDAVAHGRRA